MFQATISDFENKYIVQPGEIGEEDRYLLEVDISSVSFTHHPLFSREHVLAQQVTDLFRKYSHREALGQYQRLTGRLEALRRARDSLKKALDQISDPNHQQLERLERSEYIFLLYVLKRRKECGIYLATARRHRWRVKMTMKNDK